MCQSFTLEIELPQVELETELETGKEIGLDSLGISDKSLLKLKLDFLVFGWIKYRPSFASPKTCGLLIEGPRIRHPTYVKNKVPTN